MRQFALVALIAVLSVVSARATRAQPPAPCGPRHAPVQPVPPPPPPPPVNPIMGTLTERDYRSLAEAGLGDSTDASDAAWSRLTTAVRLREPAAMHALKTLLDDGARTNGDERWQGPRRAEAMRLLIASEPLKSGPDAPFTKPQVGAARPALSVDEQLGIADAWVDLPDAGRAAVNALIADMPEEKRAAAWRSFAREAIDAHNAASLPPPDDAWLDTFHPQADRIAAGVRALSSFRRSLIDQGQRTADRSTRNALQVRLARALEEGAPPSALGEIVYHALVPAQGSDGRRLDYEARLRDGSMSLEAYTQLLATQIPAMAARERETALATSEIERRAASNGPTSSGNGVLRDGNRVDLLLDGKASFAERAKVIAAAQSSIHLQTFILRSDDTGWALAKALVSKANQGVKVRVLYDSLGSASTSEKMIAFMRNGGVEVRSYGHLLTQPLRWNARWHQKHLVVDGATAVEGGMNIADEYALGGTGKIVTAEGKAFDAFRDVDIAVRGPSVADIQERFLENWSAVGGKVDPTEKARAPIAAETERASQGVPVRFVHSEGDGVTKAYVTAFDAATSSITIETAYFLPPPEIRDALLRAARRGVDVRVMVNAPSNTSGHNWIAAVAARSYYPPLLAGGVRIYARTSGGLLHAKTAVIDGNRAFVGSHNLNGRSRYLDSESVVEAFDARTGHALEQRFTDGLSQAPALTSDSLSKESMYRKALERALGTFGANF